LRSGLKAGTMTLAKEPTGVELLYGSSHDASVPRKTPELAERSALRMFHGSLTVRLRQASPAVEA
jgi:hypothetical protein